MPVENYYKVISKDKDCKDLLKKKHNPNYGKTHYLEIPFRMLIIAPSGAGKTNTVINLIKTTSGSFKRIIVCCKSKDEPLYEFLDIKLPVIFYEGIDEIPTIEDLMEESDGEKIETLIIFDDLVMEKQQKAIIDFYIRGRKFNCSMVYLSQNYYSIPKIIRTNCNYIILKTLSGVNDLKMILREYNMSSNLDGIMNLYRFANSCFENFFLVDVLHNRFYKNWMTLLN